MSTCTIEDSSAAHVEVLNEDKLRAIAPLDDYGLTPELIEAGFVDVTPDKDGGVLKLVLLPGYGTDLPAPDDHVYIHYKTSLKNGKPYDDSRKRGRPFTFVGSKDTAIRGLTVGVATMARKEVAILRCRSDYGYSQAGRSPHVPPNAALIFEVELLDFMGDDISDENNGLLFKTRLVKGEEYGSPNESAQCEIHTIGHYNGRIFEDRDVSFLLGTGVRVGVVDGVEIGLRRMTQGETARFRVKSPLAYGSKGCPNLEIPPNADLDFRVDLKSFKKGKEFWDLDTNEKLQFSVDAKAKGTEHFKDGEIKVANFYYGRVIEYLQFSDNLEGEDGIMRNELILSAYLNSAMCCLKLDKPEEAIVSTTKALGLDSINVKALFRRGLANVAIQEYDLAMTDFKTALQLDPKNRAIHEQVAETSRLIKERLVKERQMYAKMLEMSNDTCVQDCKDCKDSQNQSCSDSQEQNVTPCDGDTQVRSDKDSAVVPSTTCANCCCSNPTTTTVDLGDGNHTSYSVAETTADGDCLSSVL